MSYLSVGTVRVQSDGLNSALSPVIYGDVALSIKINTQIQVRWCLLMFYISISNANSNLRRFSSLDENFPL